MGNSKDLSKENQALSKENAALQRQLNEAMVALDLNRKEIKDPLPVTKTEDNSCRLLIEKMHDGAIALDKDGLVLHCNSSFAKMMNLPPEKILGTMFENYVDESSRENFAALLQKSSDNNVKDEVYIDLNNGSAFSVLMSVKSRWLDNIFGTVVIVTDLTNPDKNNPDIALLAAIVESSDDAIISKTLEGTIKSWNKGSEKMFGYTAQEVIGRPITIIIPSEYISEENQIINKIYNNEIVHYETIRNKKSGERFNVSITVCPLKDPAGKIIGASKIARDITAQKKLENELIRTNNELALQNRGKEEVSSALSILNEELKESKDRFFKIFDNNPVSMVMTNLETGKVQNANESFLSFFGFSCEELIGKTTIDLKIYDIESRSKYIEMLSKEGKLTGLESLVRKKNGEHFWILGTAQIITLDGVKFILTSFQDINNRKKAEDELKTKTIQLEQKNLELKRINKELAVQIAEKEKGKTDLSISANNVKELEELVSHKESILAVLSHDLRSPLAGIIGLADYLKTGFEDLERSEIAHVINLLDESAKKELTMLDNLVEWARIKYAAETFTPTEIKLYHYVQKAIDALHETASLKQITVDNEIEEYTTVFADGNMLLSILQNLVSNAIKYSNAGGTVSIRSKIQGDKVIVEVRDHGAGMSEETISQLFTPQVNCLSEARGENKGAGIGLLLAKQFLAKNHGDIWVESVEGEGSTFYFSLPGKELF